jgi:uncharacterized protein (TIGR02271 family)
MPNSKKAVAAAGWSSADDAYWRESHTDRPYLVTAMDYDADYLPAYRYGVTVGSEAGGREYPEVEKKAAAGWAKARGKSRLTWDQAAPAVRDSYDRVIQLREEVLHADKETVRAGDVKVGKRVKTERKSVTVPIEREEVVIERRAVDRPDKNGSIKAEEIRIPVSAEKVTARKETVLTEEVKIGKKTVTDTRKVEGDVRHEELVVETAGKAKVRQADNRKKS